MPLLPYSHPTPGQTEVVYNTEHQPIFGNLQRVDHHAGILIAAAAVDAGSSPTTVLRAGLVMGRIAASGQYKAYDPAATDGSQIAIGVLDYEENLLNPSTGAGEVKKTSLMVGGRINPAQCHGFDEKARRDLAGTFEFADYNYAGWIEHVVAAGGTTYTAIADTDKDKLFVGTGATLTVTLPLLADSVGQRFAATKDVANEPVAFARAGSDTFASTHTLATVAAVATSVAFLAVEARYVNGTLVWWVIDCHANPYALTTP